MDEEKVLLFVLGYKGKHEWHTEPVFDEAPDDTEGIMEGAVGLLQHQLIGATHHN